MKKESGLNIIGVILVMALIIIVSIFLINNYRNTKTEELGKTLKSNMQLIQGKCKVLYQDSIAKKEGVELVGKKLSEVDNYEINVFKSLGVISEEEYEKYYVLEDEDLEKLKLELTNEAGSYYLINYETGNVIITQGINGKFTLGEFEKEEEEKKQNEISEKNKEDNNSEEEVKQEDNQEESNEE